MELYLYSPICLHGLTLNLHMKYSIYMNDAVYDWIFAGYSWRMVFNATSTHNSITRRTEKNKAGAISSTQAYIMLRLPDEFSTVVTLVSIRLFNVSYFRGLLFHKFLRICKGSKQYFQRNVSLKFTKSEEHERKIEILCLSVRLCHLSEILSRFWWHKVLTGGIKIL
jgi:hypothetical protein